MAKLKGKSGQQRMVVEHVTIGRGGKAILAGTVNALIGGEREGLK